MKCRDCAHWSQKTKYLVVSNTGICKTLMGDKIDIEVDEGACSTLHEEPDIYAITEDDFFCAGFKSLLALDRREL